MAKNIYILSRFSGAKELPEDLWLESTKPLTDHHQPFVSLTLVDNRLIHGNEVKFDPPIKEFLGREVEILAVSSARTITDALISVGNGANVYLRTIPHNSVAGEANSHMLEVFELQGAADEITLTRLVSEAPFTLRQNNPEKQFGHTHTLVTHAGDEITLTSLKPIRSLKAHYAPTPESDVGCM